MALHQDVTATGLPVFFAHPHSPWERRKPSEVFTELLEADASTA